MKENHYLLIVQVFQEKVAEEVVVALAEIGVKEAVSLTAVNEFRRLPYNISIFSDFKGALGKASSLSKTFMAIVQDESIPEALMASLKRADIHFVEDDLGAITLVPVHSFYRHETPLTRGT